MDIFNLCSPTYKNTNVLDIIITRSGETSVSTLSVHDPVISDHFAVHYSLAIKKPPTAKLTVMTRKLCNIDSDSLCADLLSSSLYNLPSLDLPELLRANVCKNRATGGHGQKLNFPHILSIHTY